MTGRLLAARTLQGGALSATKLVGGLVKVKVLALTLGVEGVGTLALATQFYLAAVAIVSMSLAVGFINRGRPLLIQRKSISTIAVTVLTIITANIFAFVLLCWLFFGGISEQVFSGLISAPSIWALVVAVGVSALANGYCEGLFFLFDRFEMYVAASILATVADTGAFVGGALLGGVQGAIIAQLISSLALLCAFAVMSRRVAPAGEILKGGRFSGREAVELLQYSLVMLSTIATSSAITFAARAWLVKTSGPDENGLLQVSTSLAAYLTPFVTTGIWGHLHPLAAAHGDSAEARIEFQRVFDLGARLALISCIGVMLLGPWLISLVYTSQFSEGSKILPTYFVGHWANLLATIYGIYVLAVGQRVRYLKGWMVFQIVFAVVAYALIPLMGAHGFGIAYSLASIAIAVVVVLRAGKLGHISRQAQLKLFLALVCITMTALVTAFEPHFWLRVLLGVCFFAVWFSPREFLKDRKGFGA